MAMGMDTAMGIMMIPSNLPTFAAGIKGFG